MLALHCSNRTDVYNLVHWFHEDLICRGVLPPVPPIDNSGDWTTITTTTTTLTTTSGLGQQRSAGKFRSSMNRTCAADRHPLYYSNLSGRALWNELFPDVNLSSFNDSAKSMIRKHDMDQYLHEGWRRRAPRSSTSNNNSRREKRTLRDIRRSKQAQLLQHVPRSDSMGYRGAIEQHDETVGLNDSFFKIKDIAATNLRKEFSTRTTTHSKSSAWTQEQQASGDAHRQQLRAQQQQLPGNSPHFPSKGHHPITPTALSTTPTATGKQSSSRTDHAHHHPVAESSDEKRKLLRSDSRERRKDRSDSRERRKDRSDSRERRKDRSDSGGEKERPAA